MPCCEKGEAYTTQASRGNFKLSSANVSASLTCEGMRVGLVLRSLPAPKLACECLHTDCQG
eukprot:5161227-Prymnesium_polylepis.1